MKKIIVVFGFLLATIIIGQSLYCQSSMHSNFQGQEESACYIAEIINNSDLPLIISSPFFLTEPIVVTKNISLDDETESVPTILPGYQNSLTIPARTKSFITNLRLPQVNETEMIPESFRLRPNNYNPLTMKAIGFHVPPQSYALNYTLVHKSLPIFALRQKGPIRKDGYCLESIFGEGLHAIVTRDQKNIHENNQFYSIEVDQSKPVSYEKSIPHETHELYDLSTMYLDGGAEVVPLSVGANTFDVVINKK